jgi:hypothetical protein
MAVHEMLHKLPYPLKPRVFPVLVVTAFIEPRAFIIVQIPIEASELAYISESIYCKVGKEAVPGRYASVEYCYLDDSNHTQWVMAVSSNTRGFVPMWAQKMGVPGAIAKDVPLFLDWTHGRRSEHEVPAVATPGKSAGAGASKTLGRRFGRMMGRGKSDGTENGKPPGASRRVMSCAL